MIKLSIRRFVSKLALLALLALPEIASAQVFTYNYIGDVLAGFRKTGVYAGNYELMVNLGSVTNFLTIPSGTTINITNFSPSQLSDAFPSGYSNLQWSVSAACTSGKTAWVTPVATFPQYTIWYTLPGTNVSTQTQPPNRDGSGGQANTRSEILSAGNGAVSISGFVGASNADNTLVLVREPVVYSGYILTASIGDFMNPAIGDFGANGTPLQYVVENTTPNNFTSAVRSDFYQLCPREYADPITGLTNYTPYFVGYFILNPNGTMTFTRGAATPPAPVAGFSGSPTTGFTPLQVLFTDASSGTISNWVWSFGDGQSVTNTTSTSVNHTYSAVGSYTVTLTVNGPGGSNSSTQSGYVATSPTPKITNVTRSGGSLVFSGTNCPANVQYRILTSTNVALPVASWQPVATNTFLGNGTFSFTNSTSGSAAFFRLVSP